MKQTVSILFAFSMLVSFAILGAEDFEVKHSTAELKGATGEETWKGLWDKYFAQNDSNKKNRYEQNPQLYRVTVVDENAIVFFTKDTHPAHPSFAKISLVAGEGNSMTIRTFGFTWGHRKSYEKFMQEEVLVFSKAIARKAQQGAAQ